MEHRGEAARSPEAGAREDGEVTVHALRPKPQNVALVYVRVSRLDDDEKDRRVSPAMQKDRALALPDLAGMTVEIYEDLNLSGKNTNRPGYQRMLARLADGDVRYVVAYDLSRITRDVGDQQDFARALERAGALFVESARGRIRDLSDEDEEFAATIEGAGNQRERRKTSRRLRDTFAKQASDGVLIGSLPPGYFRKWEHDERTGKRLRCTVQFDEPAADTVRAIFRQYATGGYSQASLARWLNTHGYPVLKRKNSGQGARAHGVSVARQGMWTAGSLHDLLKNGRYAGLVARPDGSVVTSNAYPPIVDAATWSACERVRQSQWFRTKREPGATKAESPFLLTGLLRCHKCGSTMAGHTAHGRKGQRRRTYRCYALKLGTCRAAPVPKERIEAELVAVLGTMALPPGFAAAVDKAVAARLRTFGKAQTVSAEALAGREKRIRDLYELGHIDLDEYRRKHAEIQEQRDSLAARPAPLLQQQQTVLQTLVQDWSAMTDAERKQVLASIFDRINGGAEGIERLEPCEDWRPYVIAAMPKPVELRTARKSDGSRANAVVAPVGGPSLSIRKFRSLAIPLKGDELSWCAAGGLLDECADILERCVVAKANIVVSGATGSGKSTFVRSLAGAVPAHERLIVIEDTNELVLPHPHVVHLECVPGRESASVGVADLVANALRMRPDRIIVGEVRTPREASALLEALSTGHDGTLTSLHARSAADAIARLELLLARTGELGGDAARRHVLRSIDLVVHLVRDQAGLRLVHEIAAIDDDAGPAVIWRHGMTRPVDLPHRRLA
jgi:type IV secretory pathway ATPase VirB11/archaellum biosynthesis ATPase/DNA invertase Pin-like site-specific DNA recombinase